MERKTQQLEAGECLFTLHGESARGTIHLTSLPREPLNTIPSGWLWDGCSCPLRIQTGSFPVEIFGAT